VKLACLYSEGDVEILGDPSSLVAFGDSLRSLGPETNHELLDIPVGAADGCATRLVVAVTSGPASIHRYEDKLTISGGAGPLAILGRNIAWLGEHADDPDIGNHIHVEHLADTDDYYIASDSIPLVVSIRDPML
jgi:hypothetical protein